MKKELVEKLCAFNLSPNQAKVYAYLCEVRAANISDITEATRVYAQDVYKAVAALEKKGLVLRTKTQPLIIAAIPAEQALQTLINSIESKSRKEIEMLRRYSKEIALENKKALQNLEAKKESKGSVMVFEKQAPESRVDLAFDNLKEEYDCIVVDGASSYRKLSANYGKIQFKKISKRSVKIKMLFVGKGIDRTQLEATIKMMPKKDYEVKTLTLEDNIPCPSLALIDSKELWLTTPSIGKEDATIVTDVKEVVEIVKWQFEMLWNNPKAKTEAKNTSKGKTLEQTLIS
ncbi:MAG: helix-turn-helix domain-containing protein [Candidatus Bathyarchaeia archaeon]